MVLIFRYFLFFRRNDFISVWQCLVEKVDIFQKWKWNWDLWYPYLLCCWLSDLSSIALIWPKSHPMTFNFFSCSLTFNGTRAWKSFGPIDKKETWLFSFRNSIWIGKLKFFARSSYLIAILFVRNVKNFHFQTIIKRSKATFKRAILCSAWSVI